MKKATNKTGKKSLIVSTLLAKLSWSHIVAIVVPRKILPLVG